MRRVLAKVRAYAEPPAVRAWALVELGHFEHHAGDPRRAVALFLEALDVLPGSPAALEGLAGVVYGVDRNVETAIRLYGAAREHGGHLDLLAVLADLEEERGREERAGALREELMRRATADPRSLRWALRPLAFTLADERGTVCRALAFARRDLADRRDSGSWDALAWTLYRTGDVAAAYEASLEATSWGTPEPGIAYRAGVIAASTGDEERARSMLGVALDGRTELTRAEIRDAERRLAGDARDRGPARVDCD
jgi:tetratricopeptide (TPR) repeat protein